MFTFDPCLEWTQLLNAKELPIRPAYDLYGAADRAHLETAWETAFRAHPGEHANAMHFAHLAEYAGHALQNATKDSIAKLLQGVAARDLLPMLLNKGESVATPSDVPLRYNKITITKLSDWNKVEEEFYGGERLVTNQRVLVFPSEVEAAGKFKPKRLAAAGTQKANEFELAMMAEAHQTHWALPLHSILYTNMRNKASATTSATMVRKVVSAFVEESKWVLKPKIPQDALDALGPVQAVFHIDDPKAPKTFQRGGADAGSGVTQWTPTVTQLAPKWRDAAMHPEKKSQLLQPRGHQESWTLETRVVPGAEPAAAEALESHENPASGLEMTPEKVPVSVTWRDQVAEPKMKPLAQLPEGPIFTLSQPPPPPRKILWCFNAATNEPLTKADEEEQAKLKAAFQVDKSRSSLADVSSTAADKSSAPVTAQSASMLPKKGAVVVGPAGLEEGSGTTVFVFGDMRRLKQCWAACMCQCCNPNGDNFRNRCDCCFQVQEPLMRRLKCQSWECCAGWQWDRTSQWCCDCCFEPKKVKNQHLYFEPTELTFDDKAVAENNSVVNLVCNGDIWLPFQLRYIDPGTKTKITIEFNESVPLKAIAQFTALLYKTAPNHYNGAVMPPKPEPASPAVPAAGTATHAATTAALAAALAALTAAAAGADKTAAPAKPAQEMTR